MSDDEIVIDLSDDSDEAVVVEGAKPDTAVAAGAPAGSEEGVDELKRQLGQFQDRLSRTEADKAAIEAKATELQSEVERKSTEIVDSNLAQIESGIAAAQAEADAAEHDYQRAQEAGDYALSAKAQRALARAEAKILRFDEAKADLEIRKAEPVARRDEPAKPRPAAPTVEQATASLDPKLGAWLRAHPEYMTDPEKNRDANAADYHVTKKLGVARNTDEYFKQAEIYLGLRQPDAEVKPTQTQRKATPMPAAPVSRESAPSNGAAGEQITLTKGEAAAATDGTLVWNYDDPTGKGRWTKNSPIGLKEMARRKAAMSKEDRYNRQFTES